MAVRGIFPKWNRGSTFGMTRDRFALMLGWQRGHASCYGVNLAFAGLCVWVLVVSFCNFD
jgi:hypothetical protein